VNPQFANLVNNDYTLTKGSPCIDSGLDDAWMMSALDLGGNRRHRGVAVDMGAYEANPAIGTIFKIR